MSCNEPEVRLEASVGTESRQVKVVTSFQVGPGLSIGKAGLKVGAQALAELGDRDAVNIKLQLLLEVVQVFIVLRTWKQTRTW